jgi:molecular chaperone GrpE
MTEKEPIDAQGPAEGDPTTQAPDAVEDDAPADAMDDAEGIAVDTAPVAEEGDPEDTATAGLEEPVEVDASLSRELDHLQDEFDDLNDRHLRLAAEFNNYRRRQEAQMTEAWARAQADLVGRFLEVLDDLQRVSALDPADEAVTVESIVEGIDLVERKFVRALKEAGAEVIDPEVGEAFDPERMEAMMRVQDETGEQEDQVAGTFQKGYVFRGNLVRPARVSVFKE